VDGNETTLFVFVWFSDDWRLAIIGCFVLVLLVIVVIVGISRRQHVAHEE
jgi:hypothetical protein